MSPRQVRAILFASCTWREIAAMDAAEPSMLCLTDDDALLLEALAFIGDLDVDAGDDNDYLSGIPTPTPSVSARPPLVQDASNGNPVASVSTNEEDVLKDTVTEVAEPLATHKWPRESPIEPVAGEHTMPSRSNKARVRRREELLYLRDLVGDLEERLSSLRNPPHDESDTAPSESETPSELVDAWEQVASRQNEQRQQSERENIKLRRLLNDQIRLGKTLERLLLKKRPNVEAFNPGFVAEKRPCRTNLRSGNAQLVFDELLANCEALFADTARVKAKFDGMPPVTPRREAQLIHDQQLGITVQTMEHRIVPFDWECTAEVFWSSFPEGSSAHRFHDYLSKDLTEDTMKLQFRATSDIGRKRSEFEITMAMRRFVEAKRIVLVVSALFEPVEIQETNVTGVRIRHSGWSIFEPMPSQGFGSGRDATNLCVHHISVPDVDGDLKDEARKVGTLSNFMLGAIAVEMESRNQNLDDRLLEKSLMTNRSIEE